MGGPINAIYEIHKSRQVIQIQTGYTVHHKPPGTNQVLYKNNPIKHLNWSRCWVAGLQSDSVRA